MRRVVFLLSLVAAGVFAASAGATKPEITHFSDTGDPLTVSGICSFDVVVNSTVRGTEIDYFDGNGALTRVYIHVVEQDTFSRNGKEITGEPYTFNIEVLFDADGNVTHIFASGVAEKIILPDGTLFISAGRLDFILHPGADFLISPDVGNPGDVAAFCDALS